MKTIDSPIEAVQTVEGWLNNTEGKVLFQLARNCKGRGVIVEIGSWKGRSTILLGHGSKAGSGAKIHAVDPHTGSPQHREAMGEVWTFNEFQRNIKAAGMDDVVVPHVEFSEAAARTFSEPIELIFIDGLHEYEDVKIDFEAWFPKVIEGGTMVFHDSTCWDGVRKVVSDGLFKSKRFRKVRFASSLTYGQKVAHNTWLERVENRVMLCAFLAHALIARLLWRLVHDYLDFPIARALIRRLKGKRVPQVQPSIGV